jgi:hypothetical protein
MLAKSDNNFSKKEYRIFEVKPSKNTGTKVKIKYYDTKSFEVFEKEDEWAHITPTIEINAKKYGFKDAEDIASILRNIFPGTFEAKKYGKRNISASDYSDSDFYRHGEETEIIWHRGKREDRHTLEFYLDVDKKKQIFIRNGKKRFKARTRVLSNTKLLSGKKYLEDLLEKYSIMPEDISINERKKFIEVKCEEKLLKNLDSSFFRINVYESPTFNREVDAEAYLDELKKVEGFKKHIDQSNVVSKRLGEFNVKYSVRVTVDKHDDFIERISKSLVVNNKSYSGMVPLFEKKGNRNVQVLKSREELWDPLHLNSPKKQLRNFFPPHMLYDPSKKLDVQANTKVPAFTHYVSEKPESSLESAVESAFQFYLKNSAIIDLEVTAYDKNNKKDITGRVYMAVLESERENKIYMTRDAWLDDDVKSFYLKKIKEFNEKNNLGVELVFADCEIDLIGYLAKDAKVYEYIIGHNFVSYDQKHLVKFNEENELRKQDKISDEQMQKIKSYKKKNGTSKLWPVRLDQILDTKKYVQRRIPIFGNHKLSTFANSDKLMNYDEMEDAVRSEDQNEIIKNILYTIDDGAKSTIVSNLLLKNAVFEQFACNKTIQSVFNVPPVKNFYDASARDYFMNLGTFKQRHEFSPRHNLEKLMDRQRPDELIYSLLKSYKQQEGIISGKLLFPGAIINAGGEMIDGNHAMKLIHKKMLESDDLLTKYDLLSKHHSFLHVAIDKVKNFMKAAGLEFGKRYGVEDVFKSFNLGNDEFEDAYFIEDERGISDFELSRTNYIFCAENKQSRQIVRRGLIPYDFTMLEINNKIADHINHLGASLLAKTKGLYVKDFVGLNFYLGEIRAINFKDKGLIGKVNDRELYLNRNKLHRDERDVVLKMVNYFLEYNASQEDMRVKFKDAIYAQSPIYWKNNRLFIRALAGIDPFKAKGTLSLF